MDYLSSQILSADSRTAEEEHSTTAIFGKSRQDYTEELKKQK